MDEAIKMIGYGVFFLSAGDATIGTGLGAYLLPFATIFLMIFG